jgi:glycosyltransferase involved in cell wall biosynthesis
MVRFNRSSGWSEKTLQLPMKGSIMNGFSWPRITIITPSFNQGEFIEETILSVLNQNYPNLEYVIVDGGSTDNTLDIIKKYDNRIDWWVSESDRGQSHAINKGLARATGDIINWINSDDLIFPGALYRVADCFQRHRGEVHLMVGEHARISANGRILKISSPPSLGAMSLRNLIIPIGQQSSFFTRKALELVGSLNENLHAIMDMDFYYRILNLGGRFIRFKGLVGAIRTHPKAKGVAQTELWEEMPRYIQERGGSSFNGRMNFLKMLAVRSFDRSLIRSFLLTRKFAGKSLNGDRFFS